MNWNDEIEFNNLVGKEIIKIEGGPGDDEVTFHTSEGEAYRLYHYQECRESVTLYDVDGDLQRLLDSPITIAEEVSGGEDVGPLSGYEESFTWTFYKLGTVVDTVTMRWYGSSNGHYSEKVSFGKI